ncbi:MAG: HD domain-containing protein [Desulfobacteraceae bacterium]|jgi:HD-GYP domain-containing protein (c-di-GMP phosphodiesterase class II)
MVFDQMTMQNDMLQVVNYLNAAVANTRLYSADHPQVVRNLERTHEQLQHVLKQHPEMTFLIVDDDVVLNNHALTSPPPQMAQFVALLKQCAVERITFSRDASIEGLSQLVSDLAATDREAVRSAPGITLGKVKILDEKELATQREMMAPEVQERLAALEVFRDHALDDIKDLFQQIKSTKQISKHGLGEIVQGFVQGMLFNVNPLQMLASLKTSDEYTFTHAINVCILTMAQAESLGIAGHKLYDIGVAASLHDAGKMFVPDEILNKPDKLTDEEWEHMRNHSEHGALYILKLEGIPKLAFLAALEHHIRYNASGYPNLGKNWRPNIVSQMIAVADLYDAMRSRRPYKDPKPEELIIKILREESGTAFHPRLVENFLRLIKS